jgi:hypothetical protein
LVGGYVNTEITGMYTTMSSLFRNEADPISPLPAKRQKRKKLPISESESSLAPFFVDPKVVEHAASEPVKDKQS